MNFFSELKRRNVYKVAGAYLVIAWLFIQAASIFLPAFEAPAWVMKVIIIFLVLGFPVTLILSWAFEITPEGIKRAEDVLPNESITRKTGRKLIAFTIVFAAIAAGLFVFRFVRSQSSTSAASSGQVVTDKSIAVLPFVNMSSDKEQEYFSDGLSEELLNQLAQIPQLRVIARTSSFSFKGKEVDVATIAQVLNVANILEGSVRKSAKTLRITAQLVRASDSSHVWSQTYDRELADVFKVQDEIARDVVSALKLKLLPTQQPTTLQHTSNSEAYEQVLIGKEARKHGGAESIQRAKAAFQKAVELDPNYANAYAGLADAQAFAADFAKTPAERDEEIKQAFVTADKAVALAPDLALAYGVRAYLRYRLAWDWKGAQADFRQALKLDLKDAAALGEYAQALFFSGRQNEAFAIDKKNTALDPLPPEAWSWLGWHLAFAGRYPEARAALQRSTELSPDAQWPNFHLGYVYLRERDAKNARAYFERAPAAFGPAGLAMLEYTLGHERESQELLSELEEKYAVGFAYQIAQVYGWRGEKDHAFEWLDRAYDQHDAGMPRLRYDPTLASLHDDSRFTALVKKMGFSE